MHVTYLFRTATKQRTCALSDTLSARVLFCNIVNVTMLARTLLSVLALALLLVANQSLAKDRSPKQWLTGGRDPLRDAEGVWRHGKDFFDEDSVTMMLSISDDCDQQVAFSGIDLRTGSALAWPAVSEVVQFGCTGTYAPYEASLEAALRKGTPELKLQALAILMRLRAPSSVPLQQKVLAELRELKTRPGWRPLLEELAHCFDPDRLMRIVTQDPPADRYSSTERSYLWSIRALGAIRHNAALPRLIVLSRSGQLYTSLAAERSIEDFCGEAAEQALVQCMLGWQYDAYKRAAYALLKRNKQLLQDTLLAATPPKRCRYQKALFLARCDDSASVPLLCAEVGSYQLIDGEMFDHIARLALRDHRELIERLPELVRADQRDRARSTVVKYLKRINALQ